MITDLKGRPHMDATPHFFHQIIDNLPNYIFWKDKNLIYQGCNKNFALCLGFNKVMDLVGKSDDQIAWDDDIKSVCREEEHQILTTGIPIANKVGSIKFPNKEECFLSISKVPLYNNMGEINGLLGIYWTISDKTLYKKSLLEAREASENLKKYYESIIAKMPGHVYWLDKNNVYLGCNDLMARAFQIKSRHEIIGKNNHDFLDKEQAEELNHINKQVIKNGTLKIVEESMSNNGKKATYLTQKIPLRDHNNNVEGILGISFDLTERKKLEKDLLQAKESAEKAMQAKSDFIANMSHDLRTPLSGIIGMTEILQEKLQANETKELAQMINESGEQLLGLLNSILDIAKSDKTNEQLLDEYRFDLHECLNGIIQLEKPSTKLKAIDIELVIEKAVPQFVITDRTKIHRILLNLIGNAIKFTNKGQVTIEVRLLSETNEMANVKFLVVDTGIGIPKSKQINIFDRFYRVEPSYNGVYSGHGVGLNIAQNYAHSLGSEIKVISEVEKGTTFHFDLSLKKGKQSEIHDKYPDSDVNLCLTKQTDKPLLLFIEDNPIALKLVENYAEKMHCRFISFNNGAQALAYIQSNQCDLIITDIGLPGMSGYEMTQRIREWEKAENKKPHPIIGLTAHAREQALGECMQYGMDDVYTKPINLNAVKSILAEFLSNYFTIKSILPLNETTNQNLNIDAHEIFDLNQFPLLDIESGISNIGSEDLLIEALKMMNKAEFNNDITMMKQAYYDNNWETANQLMHKIKGCAVYCGTTRMKYACQYLERYQLKNTPELFEQLYQQLIKVVDDTMEYIKEWL